jgi:tetratricopeptide (TPR) repeat protein/MFS family permease
VNRKLKYLIMCYLTAFIGGFCIMVIEIIAGRLIARYLGVSLYTWTSVIGVVLAGISLGNYIGGRIADRYQAKKALSILFILSSISCIIVPPLNNLIGNFPLLLRLSWPVRITIHIALIFFLPSCMLGMISPVVTKFALDQGFRTGRTIGNIYAWSMGGSILGTFITGFFLIAHLGSTAVVWTIAGILGVIGLLYGLKNIFSYVWITAFVFLLVVNFSPFSWTEAIANHLFFKDLKEGVVYEKDSSYSHISVFAYRNPSGLREFMLDGLTHSRMNLKEPTNPKYIYGYHKVFVDIARVFSREKKDMKVLIMGGGGYVLPHYIRKYSPQSKIEIVEIDPEVTKAAIKAFGFSPNSHTKVYHLDARNYIEDLIKNKEKLKFYDLIYNDALVGLAIPYHLTTYEFAKKIAQLLRPNGVYAINLVDSKKSKKFLMAIVNTLQKVFPYIYVIQPKKVEEFKSGYDTFIIIASLNKIKKSFFSEVSGKLVNNKKIMSKIILTDDFSPVENLLKEAFSIQGERLVCRRIMEKGERYIEEGRFEEAINQFKKALKINPEFVEAYNDIGSLNAWQGKFEEAINYYEKALRIEPEFKPALIGLASAYDRKGNIKKAEKIYKKILNLDPNVAIVYVSLGNIYFKEGKIDEAVYSYRKALEIEPYLEVARKNLEIAIKEKVKGE